MEVFSFHATKFFHTIEGGAIVTNNPEFASQARQIRNLGFTETGIVARHGTNAKMNEISAAMGLAMFADLKTLIEHNQKNYSLYRRALANLPGLKVISYDKSESQNYQFIILEIDKELTGISRDEIQKVLEFENIFTRRYFFPACHHMTPYLERPGVRHGNLTTTEMMSEQLLALPTGNTVSEIDIRKICQIIHLVVTNAGAIKTERKQRTRSAILQNN